MIKKTLITTILLIILQVNLAVAQSPGSTSDPLVSRSYVEQNLSFRSVELKENTNFKAQLGNQLIVLDGRVRYVSRRGRNLLDLTIGRLLRAGNFLSSNHLYIITSDEDFELQVKKDATILVLGISDENLNLK